MDLKNSRLKSFFSFLGVFLFTAFFLYQLSSVTQAKSLGEWWQDLLAPFKSATTSLGVDTNQVSKSAEEPVPLYKPALDYERAVIEAVKKASVAVVSIAVSKNVPVLENCRLSPFFNNVPPGFEDFFDGFNLPQRRECDETTQLKEVGGGSGFLISSDGLILTNKHVVRDEKAEYTVVTKEGDKYEAKVLARDPFQDLAVIKIEAANLPTVELGDSNSIELGQTAIAIGNALAEFRNTVSVGVISGLARTVTASDASGSETIQGLLQTDAAINPGNSGGPLLNLRGEVIGINTAIVSGAQNIGFAIPINRAKRDIESVKKSGEIQSPFLGVRYMMLTPEIAKAQKISVDRGALIRGSEAGPAVAKDSPAAKAGLREDDVVLAINGKELSLENPLGLVISEYSVGETVKLLVSREGKETAFDVVLEKRPAGF